MNIGRTSIFYQWGLFILAFIMINPLYGQDEPAKRPDRPVRNLFDSNWLMNHQTAIVPIEGTFEMDISHRFGTWNNGYDDFWGIYAPSNIRLGFSKVIMPKLQIGVGLTKTRNLWDFNLKYGIMEQTRSGRIPLSITYYGNMAIDTRDGDNFQAGTDRYSYFHQIMLARKLSDKLSMQVSGNFSHFNAVTAFLNDSNEEEGRMKNDHLSSTIIFRYKLTDITALTGSYDIHITDHPLENPTADLSIGFEFVTSSHAFHLFIGNYTGIVPQYNNFFNENSFGDNEISIGFNITRLWN